MRPVPNYFEPLITPRNLTVARRTNALVRYVAPGSPLDECRGLPAGFEDKLEESSCSSDSCGSGPCTPALETVEEAVEAAVAQRTQCCEKCSRTFLREAEVLKRVQHMLNLLASLSRGDLEVLRGLIDAKLAASVPL